MKVSITGKGENKVLVVEIPMSDPRPSSGGKMLLVASTGGFMVSDVKVDGKPIKISLNAGISAK
jgi:hypothetical protein